jgi:hypothetical protein
MKRITLTVGILTALLSAANLAAAEAENAGGEILFGIKVSAGGRYDDVRMCVATAPGTKGGPAMDISFFTEIAVSERLGVSINLPVVRPILFGALFRMLQFEPDVALLFRQKTGGKTDVIVGPTVGISLHYGPDYESPRAYEKRGPSFFALGPRFGTYLGLDFRRDGELFNFQLGLSPYISPLFSVNDQKNHHGVVAGGTLDGLFRFDKNH